MSIRSNSVFLPCTRLETFGHDSHFETLWADLSVIRVYSMLGDMVR